MSLHMTQGSTYTDRDGQVKTFTNIDWDKKTSVGFSRTEEERLKDEEDSKNILNNIINAILALPAVNADRRYDHLKNRMREYGITWNERAVRETCLIKANDPFGDYAGFLFLNVWRNTIPERNWFVDLSYEEIAEGKWKEYVK